MDAWIWYSNNKIHGCLCEWHRTHVCTGYSWQFNYKMSYGKQCFVVTLNNIKYFVHTDDDGKILYIKAWEIFFCMLYTYSTHTHTHANDDEKDVILSHILIPKIHLRDADIIYIYAFNFLYDSCLHWKTTTRSQEYEIFDTKFNEFWCKMLTTGLINFVFSYPEQRMSWAYI